MKITALLVLAAGVWAQEPPAARPQFDVVSLKPGDPNDPSSGGRSSPGGLQMRNAQVATIIRSAYGLNEYQLEGGPKWINSERFTLEVKYAIGTPREKISLMMQSMLTDRFKLQVHWSKKTISQYTLIVAKGGPKVQNTSPDEPNRGASSQGPRLIKGQGLSMSRLADMLGGVVGVPVMDRTGLTGDYNFALDFAPQLDPKEGETLPSIFSALQERLGLKLESIKAPIDILVVDAIEKPTEN